ncbi:MAG TPA: TIGR04500 family putative peptide maturation system protein [Kofleriaceae bacterium]|nr:TIGR04500 family putative peptide maturation system protein [Kofleriaceae bacterium]
MAIADVVAFLTSVTCEHVRPPDAQARLRSIQARHSEVALELVWEEESYDGSLHYDVLLRGARGGTVSISFADDRGLAWPLRGVKRSTDANLVQVNGRMLTMEEAVVFLDILWNEAPLMERMVNACLVRDELAREPMELADEELQRGLDALRRAHKLFTADATERWMRLRGLTHEQLEHQVMGMLQCAKLRRRVAAARVEGYFEAHRDAFDVDSLDAPTRETIEQILFDEWLAERRASAQITWHWGNPEHTARAA